MDQALTVWWREYSEPGSWTINQNIRRSTIRL